MVFPNTPAVLGSLLLPLPPPSAFLSDSHLLALYGSLSVLSRFLGPHICESIWRLCLTKFSTVPTRSFGVTLDGRVRICFTCDYCAPSPGGGHLGHVHILPAGFLGSVANVRGLWKGDFLRQNVTWYPLRFWPHRSHRGTEGLPSYRCVVPGNPAHSFRVSLESLLCPLCLRPCPEPECSERTG